MHHTAVLRPYPRIGRDAEIAELEPNISRRFEFYREDLFRDNGTPNYFHDRSFSIDIHNVAQSIITLLACKDLDENNVNLANAVFKWAMTNMWDEKGYFYYQGASCKSVNKQ
jgi:hypothetical protein